MRGDKPGFILGLLIFVLLAAAGTCGAFVLDARAIDQMVTADQAPTAHAYHHRRHLHGCR